MDKGDFLVGIAFVLIVLFWSLSKLSPGILENFGSGGAFEAFSELGFDREIYCPFINPFMSSLASSRVFEATGGYALDFGKKLCGVSSDHVRFELTERNTVLIECNGKKLEMSLDDFSKKAMDFALEKKLGPALTKVKVWECFLIFGLLPFFFLYNFILDLLSFAFLSPRVKKLTAAVVSVIAVVSGILGKIVVAIASTTSISLGPAFLGMLFLMAILSRLLQEFSSIFSSFGLAYSGAAQLATGYLSQVYGSEKVKEEIGKLYK